MAQLKSEVSELSEDISDKAKKHMEMACLERLGYTPIFAITYIRLSNKGCSKSNSPTMEIP